LEARNEKKAESPHLTTNYLKIWFVKRTNIISSFLWARNLRSTKLGSLGSEIVDKEFTMTLISRGLDWD
jgi:hypothetical protein